MRPRAPPPDRSEPECSLRLHGRLWEHDGGSCEPPRSEDQLLAVHQRAVVASFTHIFSYRVFRIAAHAPQVAPGLSAPMRWQSMFCGTWSVDYGALFLNDPGVPNLTSQRHDPALVALGEAIRRIR